MELGVVGDRVYAAERIMKKRVRKVMDSILSKNTIKSVLGCFPYQIYSLSIIISKQSIC